MSKGPPGTAAEARASSVNPVDYVTTVPGPASVANYLFTSVLPGKKCKGIMVKSRRDDLLYLNELVRNGSVKPVVEKTYSLSDIQEAHRHVETGRTRGKVAVSMGRT